MKHARTLILAAMTGLTLVTSGCAVFRKQESVGQYVDDKTITAKVKAKLLEDKSTSGMAIGVDSLNGTVQLSGFAKSAAEKSRAEQLARETAGVKSVRNNLVVRPGS